MVIKLDTKLESVNNQQMIANPNPNPNRRQAYLTMTQKYQYSHKPNHDPAPKMMK
jgi:hypothetical protein